MTQLANAKAAIHELSSLLDDLKRNNLMLTEENEKRLAKYVLHSTCGNKIVCSSGGDPSVRLSDQLWP